MVYPALPTRGIGRSCLKGRFCIRNRPSTTALRQFHASRAASDEAPVPTGTTARSAAAAERIQNLPRTKSNSYTSRSSLQFASRITSTRHHDSRDRSQSKPRRSSRPTKASPSRDGSGRGETQGGVRGPEEVPVEKKQRSNPPELANYEPERFSVSDLVRGHAAVLAGPLGARDVLSERMNMLAERRDRDYADEHELARRLMKGEIVRFKSDAEKASVLELCEEIAAETAKKVSKKRGTEVEPVPVGFAPISKDGRMVVLDKAVRGRYNLLEEESAGVPKALEAVQRYASLNPTYAPGNRSSILAEITTRYARSAKSEEAREAKKQAGRARSK